MKELSFAQNFALIALNAQRRSELTYAKKMALRCITAAAILELYLDNNLKSQSEILVFKREYLQSSSVPSYQEPVIEAILEKTETVNGTLQQILLKVTKLSNRILKEVEQSFVKSLTEAGALEEIPALLNCDLEYVTAGISIKEYRSHSELYTKQIESIRAEILEDGEMTEEAILMLWLLKESGCVYDIFSKEELKRVSERFNELFLQNPLAKMVLPIIIHKTTENIIKNFLRAKKEVMSTPTGAGIAFVFPLIERSEAIFIDTEEWFSKGEDRLRDIKERIEKNGNSFSVIRAGKVPLIKIDNALYEAVPSAKRYSRIPVHGVRLRKYPLSL